MSNQREQILNNIAEQVQNAVNSVMRGAMEGQPVVVRNLVASNGVFTTLAENSDLVQTLRAENAELQQLRTDLLGQVENLTNRLSVAQETNIDVQRLTALLSEATSLLAGAPVTAPLAPRAVPVQPTVDSVLDDEDFEDIFEDYDDEDYYDGDYDDDTDDLVFDEVVETVDEEDNFTPLTPTSDVASSFEFDLDDEDLEDEEENDYDTSVTEGVFEKNPQITENFVSQNDITMNMYIFVRYAHLDYHYTIGTERFKFIQSNGTLITSRV